MSEDLVPVSGRTGPIRVDVSPGVVPVVVGADSEIAVDITNDDVVIRRLNVSVLGLDPSWVVLGDPTVALFPGERRTLNVICRLPMEFPSGARRAAIEVRDSIGDLVPALVEFNLLVEAVESIVLTVEPSNVTAGKRAAFTATVANRGNTPMDIAFVAHDPEQLVTSRFTPPVITVYPKTVGVTRVDTQGKRPWMGAPQVRLLTVQAAPALPGSTIVQPLSDEAPGTSQTLVAIVQRPRLGRRLLSLLGLLVAATVFTLVIAATFGNLARKADANAALIKQSLGGNESAAGTGVAPAQMLGTVSSSTGAPLSGVTVGVFDVAKGPAVAAFTTVTDSVGGYKVAGVSAGTYRIKFSAAGFTDVWYPTAAAFEQGKDIKMAGADLTGLDAQIVGQPASVKGSVTGDDLIGATVTVRIPASELPPVPGIPASSAPPPGAPAVSSGPVVQTVAVDAAGKFVITDLPTPSDFELTAVKPGYTSRVRDISLQPGQTLDGIVLDLVKGDGKISGTVVDASGTPIGGATVVANDGTNSATTVTLSSGATAGSFELLNLITPGTYSIAASAPTYLTTNVTVRLDAGGASTPQTVVLKSSQGRVSGMVMKAGSPATPLGAAAVTVTGPDFTRTTTSLTAGAIGTWEVTGVPLPGTYTVTFALAGYGTQAVGVELSPGNPQNTSTGATLAPSLSSITGRVIEATGGAGIVGADVQLSGPGVTRTARSANQPAGAYGFANLPPGAYSITFKRTGSADLTLAITLNPGDNPQPDAAIERPSGIFGTVTVNGNAYAGAQLKIYLIVTGGPVYPYDPPTAVVLTDAAGNYSAIGIPPGNYLVDLYINGVIVPPTHPTSVSPGTPTEHVDFTVVS
ncbi:MAG: carboxypeptidase-like regulatory domain-containing protein [Ilumatobacteraceae bacterium]